LKILINLSRNSIKKSFFVLFILLNTSIFSQVVNIENVRKLNDTTRFSGAVKVDFDFEKDLNASLELTNELRLQYVFGKNKLLFVNDFSYKN